MANMAGLPLGLRPTKKLATEIAIEIAIEIARGSSREF